MSKSRTFRWTAVAAGAFLLLLFAVACGTETIEVPGETVVVEKEVIKTVEVPGETVVVEKVVTETVEVPGETVTKEVVKEVMVPGETVVVEKEVVKTVEVPGQTVVKEVVKEVMVPGETVVVEKEVVKTVEVPGQTVVVEGERFTTNVWGEVVDIPRYGGTIPAAVIGLPETFDPYYNSRESMVLYSPFVLEAMGDVDWSLPRDNARYLTSRYVDMSYAGAELAEGWNISSDLLTYTFDIREGVLWHDKAPMNGRELTAKDIEFTFLRDFGMGSGATEPNPFYEAFHGIPVESIEATGDNNLVVKLSTPGHVLDIQWLLGVGETPTGLIVPPEVIKQSGDIQDWENVVGTGPYEITAFQPGASLTLTKNPNYWQIDPIHPGLDNRLPYVDEIRLFVIDDSATRAAALRTGKTALAGGKHLSLEQALALQNTNPELVARTLAGVQSTTPIMRGDREPFNDRNVRIAMQKAINLAEINSGYYYGMANPTPTGFVTALAPGMFIPFEEWPAAVRAQYEYDPDEAERLLDEAGYPRGSDGMRIDAGWDLKAEWAEDVDLALLASSYWKKIGVNVEVNAQSDDGVYFNRILEASHGGMTHGCCRHKNVLPVGEMSFSVPVAGGYDYLDDLIARAGGETDTEAYRQIAREMDELYIREVSSIYLGRVPLIMLHQPWLKGYRGEYGGAFEGFHRVLMYAWVDQDLKQKMGH